MVQWDDDVCVLGPSGATESSWASSGDHSLTVANWSESAGLCVCLFVRLFHFYGLDKILKRKQNNLG